MVRGNVHAAGTVRRFSNADEEWFEGMLRNETRAAGFGLYAFTIHGNESLRVQAATFSKLGVVIGIHGANLVNAVFMRPLGGFVEALPKGAKSQCYLAGLNSGLAYWRHEAMEIATPEESRCSREEKRCWKVKRQRMVKIRTNKDSEECALRWGT